VNNGEMSGHHAVAYGGAGLKRHQTGETLFGPPSQDGQSRRRNSVYKQNPIISYDCKLRLGRLVLGFCRVRCGWLE
jgi:hypothetical protein